MTARIIDGKDIQRPIVERTITAIQRSGIVPELALLMVEHTEPMLRLQTEPTFDLHVNFMRQLGITVRPHRLPNSTTHDEVVELIEKLNADDDCDGIFLLVPPPPHIRLKEIIAAIDPAKELEALHPQHAARLLPTTMEPPERQMIILETLREVFESTNLDFTDKHLLIVVEREALRSNLITQLVARLGNGVVWPADTALTVLHTEDPELPEYCRKADVVILVILTHPKLVRGDWIKPGAHVYDFAAMVVGSRPHPADPTRQVPVLVGGANNDEIAEVAEVLCPAPRGFGPVMLSLLAENLVQAAIARRSAPR